jgi:hypothetical protein
MLLGIHQAVADADTSPHGHTDTYAHPYAHADAGPEEPRDGDIPRQ